jgi:hypothetical protein
MGRCLVPTTVSLTAQHSSACKGKFTMPPFEAKYGAIFFIYYSLLSNDISKIIDIPRLFRKTIY